MVLSAIPRLKMSRGGLRGHMKAEPPCVWTDDAHRKQKSTDKWCCQPLGPQRKCGLVVLIDGYIEGHHVCQKAMAGRYDVHRQAWYRQDIPSRRSMWS